jgi:hypothetical protein
MKNIPKTSVYTKLLIVFVLIGLIAIATGLSLWYYNYSYKLNKYGVTVKGVVVERYNGAKSAVDIGCSFNINKKVYTVSATVNSFEYRNSCFFGIGDSVIIIYNPTDPTVCKVDLTESYNLWKNPKPKY